MHVPPADAFPVVAYISQPLNPRLTGPFWIAAATASTMGDEDNVAAIKEALIANGPKTAPIDPRFPNTNQVRAHTKRHSDHCLGCPVFWVAKHAGLTFRAASLSAEQVLLCAVHQVPAVPEGERR